MGSSSLLQHKSYNVHSAQNIARVKRDEESARQKKQVAIEKTKAFERSQRLDILRNRRQAAASPGSNTDSQTESPVTTEEKSQLEKQINADITDRQSQPYKGDFKSIPDKTWYTRLRSPGIDTVGPVVRQKLQDPLELIKFYEKIADDAEAKRHRNLQKRRRHYNLKK